MIDWTNEGAAAYWHDCKRSRLIAGSNIDFVAKCQGTQGVASSSEIVGFWTDLGEPEMYNQFQQYYGYQDNGKWYTSHGDVLVLSFSLSFYFSYFVAFSSFFLSFSFFLIFHLTCFRPC
jgi:hypothetical protein